MSIPIPESNILLTNCLYFTANSLARTISRMADEVFKPTGLSPSHAFLLMLVNERPGITPSELAAKLNLAPSTVTRFVDALKHKGFVTKASEGKASKISPTQAGRDMSETMAKAWKALYHKYSDVLGEQEGRELTATIHEACERLEEK